MSIRMDLGLMVDVKPHRTADIARTSDQGHLLGVEPTRSNINWVDPVVNCYSDQTEDGQNHLLKSSGCASYACGCIADKEIECTLKQGNALKMGLHLYAMLLRDLAQTVVTVQPDAMYIYYFIMLWNKCIKIRNKQWPSSLYIGLNCCNLVNR